MDNERSVIIEFMFNFSYNQYNIFKYLNMLY